jgi:hypothetical protein
MSRTHSQFPLRRRDLLKGGASLAAAAGLPGGLVGSASAAANTLVIAAPATPQSLINFDVSPHSEAIAVLYDNLLEFKKISTRSSQVLSAKTADHPDLPAGLAIQGKLAESFELDPAESSFASIASGYQEQLGQ